tara:strand:- start:1314 stop:1949 length:636 start_codon:yes stop_codon:yes gene_type:complete
MDFLILSIVSIITLINPVGIIPNYINLIDNFSLEEQKEITLKACLVAFLVLIIFAVMGNFIFIFFNLTIYAFKVVGGVLFFRIGLNMLESKISRTKSTPMEEKEAMHKDDITYTPLGIPLIAGPGAITSVMILSENTSSITEKAIFIVAIFVCILSTYFILSASKKLSKMIGMTGIRIVQRVMGIILMAIAVQFIFDGLYLAFDQWLIKFS